MIRKKKKYTDVSNVEANRRQQVPEEFPEGAFGSTKKVTRDKGKNKP